jgi:hypothetical protein
MLFTEATHYRVARVRQGAEETQVVRAGIARDRPETSGDGSDRRLHCEDSAEPGLALRNALVRLRRLCQ